MLEFIRNITSRRNEDGASAVEYGLLVAGIAALIVAIVFLFGGVVKNTFNSTCGKISSGVANGNGTVAATTCA
ncbi:MAG: Flp family type IVb pilin [Marmoricola sp.]